MALVSFGGPAAYAFALLHGAGNGILTIAKGTLPLALFGPVGYGRRQGIVTAPARASQAFDELGRVVYATDGDEAYRGADERTR